MISKWRWTVLQITHRLWFRATLFALLAIVTALMAIALRRFIPSDFEAKMGADAVDNILNILAASMLTVTTFSLSVMVAAYAAATTSATPRATRLLIEDSTTQNVLATFIGSFMFSLVGIIALSAGVYGGNGRVVLFVVTIFVVILIVVTIVRWVDYLTRFGRVGETTHRVEQATATALKMRKRRPALGGIALGRTPGAIPGDAVPVYHPRTGYVQHIDMGSLSKIADRHEVRLYLTAVAGTFVTPRAPIIWVSPPPDEGADDELRDAFTIGDERNFDQDPRFGFVVLAEIASRALSPGINDAGTAIDVIGRAVRLLLDHASEAGEDEVHPPEFDRIHVPLVRYEDLLEDVFDPILRDGAGSYSTQVRLIKAMAALAQSGNPELRDAALALADKALEVTKARLPLERDLAILRELRERI